MKRACFSGHSKHEYNKMTREALKQTIDLLIKLGVTEFMVGNYGNFDRLCASVLKEMKKEFPQMKILLTVPYVTESVKKKADEFDEVVIPELPMSTPRNLKIIKCNEHMVDVSDALVSYVKYDWGGAARTLDYAQRKKRSSYESAIDIYYIAEFEQELINEKMKELYGEYYE